MRRFFSLCSALALLALAVPAFGLEPFNFVSPVEIEVAGVDEARASYLVHLDLPGDPVVNCWKDSGLMHKACALLHPADDVGYFGFLNPLSSPASYDLRNLTIVKGPTFIYDPNPFWSVELGCVVSRVDQGGGTHLVTITDGDVETTVRCNQGDLFTGNLFGRVCQNLAPNDCGTFGADVGGTWPELKQIVARKGYFGY